MVGRKWIQVRFLGWQGVQWLSFQKLALYFSSTCHLQETEGGYCLSLSCYTKEDASWRVERGAASLAKSHRMPEWSYLQGVLLLIPVGGNLWLWPQQQVANCLQCSLGCRNRSKKPCEGENWIDPMSLRTMLRWMMNGYFGNLTNTMIYIHDGLIPEGFLEWAYSRVLWSFRVWTEWKMIWKAIPCEVQGQEDWVLYNLLFNQTSDLEGWKKGKITIKMRLN